MLLQRFHYKVPLGVSVWSPASPYGSTIPWPSGHVCASASAERVFSLAGRIFNDYTQNMQSEKLEERMWAKVNQHAIKKLQKKVGSAVAGV